MKTYLPGLALVGVLAVLAGGGVWVSHLLDRAEGGSQAYHYLYDPLPNIKGPKGEVVRRVDILDAALEDYLRRQAPTPTVK